jgi:C-terminal processing protease CtpA/Prc
MEEFEAKDLETVFLTAIAENYDPHSNFFSDDALEDFSISMSNKLVGLVRCSKTRMEPASCRSLSGWPS